VSWRILNRMLRVTARLACLFAIPRVGPRGLKSLFGVLTLVSVSPRVMGGDPVAWWVADDFSTGSANWVDRIGKKVAVSYGQLNNAQGVAFDNGPVKATGQFRGGAASAGIVLDGVNDYFEVTADNNPVAGQKTVTIVALFKASQPSTGIDGNHWRYPGPINAEAPGAPNDFGLTVGADGKAHGFFNDAIPTTSPVVVVDGLPHTLVLTWSAKDLGNGLTGDGIARFYVDGVLQGSLATDAGSGIVNYGMRFGRDRETTDRWFRGTLGELRFYASIEDPTEIHKTMAGQKQLLVNSEFTSVGQDGVTPSGWSSSAGFVVPCGAYCGGSDTTPAWDGNNLRFGFSPSAIVIQEVSVDGVSGLSRFLLEYEVGNVIVSGLYSVKAEFLDAGRQVLGSIRKPISSWETAPSPATTQSLVLSRSSTTWFSQIASVRISVQGTQGSGSIPSHIWSGHYGPAFGFVRLWAESGKPTAPLLAGKNAPIQVVVDNDYALLAGSVSGPTRLVYQPGIGGWSSQFSSSVSGSVRMNLLEGESHLYLVAMGGGGAEGVQGKINGVDLTSLAVPRVQTAVGSQGGYRDISGSWYGFSPSYVQDGGFSVSLAQVQSALQGSIWGVPASQLTPSLTPDLGPSAWPFPSATAVAFRFQATALALVPIPGDSSASLSWLPPSIDGGLAVTDFRIQYSTDGSQWVTFSDGVSATTSAVVTGLINGTAYRFRVAAINDSGVGYDSVESASVRPIGPFAPISVAGTEDQVASFTSSTFTSAFSNGSGPSLYGIRIESLPSTGTLKLSGNLVVAGDFIITADLGQLSYEPAANETGAKTFEVQASDGLSLAAKSVVSVVLAPANDAPTISASGFQKIYETVNPRRASDGAIVYAQGYGTGTSDAAAQFSATGQPIYRIRYRMDLTVGGTARYAEATFDGWNGVTAAGLRIPDDTTPNKFALQRDVSNLSVDSNYQTVSLGSGFSGRLEIWPYNYAQTQQSSLVGGSSAIYDLNDTYTPNDNGHGSFQVHNLTRSQTVFAWNMHRPGGPPEIGFGNSPNGDPDWTSNSSLGSTGWKLQISVESSPVPSVFALTEDTPGNLTFYGTPFADVDGDTLTVTLVVPDGTITGATGQGVTVTGTGLSRQFTGTAAALNAYFTTPGKVVYQGSQNGSGNRILTTTVSDGKLTASSTSVLAIAPVNDAPTVMAPQSITATEDLPVDIVYPANAFTDVDGDPLTVTLLVDDGTIEGKVASGIGLGGTAQAFSFKGTVADLNAYFTTPGNITYRGAANSTVPRVLTTRVSDGFVVNEPPVAGYARWFDASKLRLANGATVTRWPDGGAMAADAVTITAQYVTQNETSTRIAKNNPTYLADAGTGTGLGAVSFQSDQALGFTRDESIRTVFSVFKGSSFLLTDWDKYHFHRPSDNKPADPLWNTDTSILIRGGVTYVNGAEVNGQSFAMPTTQRNGFNLVSVVTAGNVQADSFNRDRVYHSGVQTHAEVILYDRVLTAAERASVESYLNSKWFGVGQLPVTSVTATSTVDFLSVNDAPIVIASQGATAAIEQVEVAVDAALTVSDVDSATLASATVTVSGGFQPSEDVLAFTNLGSQTHGNISGSYVSATGALTLTSTGATATLAQWQSALRAVTYRNTSDTPNTANRTVTVVANDGISASTAVTKSITITPVNDAPVLTSVTPLTGATEDTDFTITYEALAAAADESDVDSTNLRFRIESVSSGTLTLGGVPVTAGTTLLAAGQSLLWRPAQDANGVIEAFKVKVWDGQAASPTAVPVTVQVAAVNDAPKVFADGSGPTVAAESAAAIKSLTGTTANGVYWVQVNGVPTQVYCIMDTAIDGGGWMLAMKGANTGNAFGYSSPHWTTPTTLNPTYLRGNTAEINEDAKFPVFNDTPADKVMAIFPTVPSTLHGGAVTGQSYGFLWIENMPTPQNTATYNGRPVQGNYAGKTLRELFAGGEKIFIRDATLNTPYRAAGAGLFSTQRDVRFFGFNYRDANGGGGGNKVRFGFGFNENDGGLYPFGDEHSNNISGGIGLERADWSAGDVGGCCTDSTGLQAPMAFELYVKAFSGPSAVAVTLTPIAEDVADSANPGDPVAIFAPGISDPDSGSVAGIAVTAVDEAHGKWSYSMNAGQNWLPLTGLTATSARLLRTDNSTYRVRFVPDSDFNGTATLTYRAWDGTSGTAGEMADTTVNGGGSAFSSGMANASVVVTPVNDAPVANAQSVTTVEDTAKTIILAGTDVDGSPLTYAVLTQPSQGTLSGTAPNLTYTPNPNANGGDSFTFQVKNGLLDSQVATVSITINPVNDAPVLGSILGVVGSSFFTDFSTLHPKATLAGVAKLQNGELVLTEAVNSQYGYMTLEPFSPNPSAFVAEFQYRVFDGTGADGVSFNYGLLTRSLVAPEYGTYTPENGIISREVGGTTDTGLAVSFIEWGWQRVVVRAYNTTLATIPFVLMSPDYRKVRISVDDAGKLSVSIGGQSVVSQVDLGQLYRQANKTSWQFGFGARTGGSNNRHSLNDLSIESRDVVPNAFSVAEDVPGGIALYGVPFADVDSTSLTVTLEVPAGTLTGAEVAGVVVGGSAQARTFTGTPADLNAYFARPGNITYQSALNASGDIALIIRLSDGQSTTSTTSVLSITPVNDAPSLAAISVNGTEDTIVALDAALFTSAYSDVEQTTLASITVVSLPTSGTLKLSGNVVVAGQVITAQELANLAYLPAANENGAKIFTVTASDGALSSPAATVTINLAPVNDAPTLNLGISGQGGTKTVVGDYAVHTFTSPSGTFTPSSSGVVEVLVVGGGGGGGGSYVGGGGGGGGFVSSTTYAVNAGEAISVLVGGGGKGGTFGIRGANGGESRFGSLVAAGGGGGGSFGDYTTATGLAGGSGGGSGWQGGQGVGGAGVAGQGSSGGPLGTSPANHGGGGGGAGGTPDNSGVGGPGLASSISGSSVYYAGGGAAGTDHSIRLAGGVGGGGSGGDGASSNRDGLGGQANTGGGGGGGHSTTPVGGDGGSGIVIVRYLSSSINFVDTAASDTFSNYSGTLAGADVDANTTLIYGISGVTAVDGVFTKVGTYGTLVVNSATGAFTYTPDPVAINRLSANAFDSFLVTVTDNATPALSSTATLSVSITAANDAPTIAAIPAQTTLEDTATAPIVLSVADSETPAARLTVTASSSNPDVVAASGISLGFGTPSQGLIGQWSFDSADDLGKNSVTGDSLVKSGAPAWTSSGKLGGALELNGSSWLSASSGTIDKLPLGNSTYSVSLWFKARTFGAKGFVGWGDYGKNNKVNAFRLDGNGRIVNYWWANDLSAPVGSTLSPNVWYHAVATYDGTRRSIYLNGQKIGSLVDSMADVQPLNFGIGKTVNSEYFDGWLDEVAIYDRALSDTEVAQLAEVAGNDRTITVTPVPNATGTSTITVTVTDEANATATTSFTVTVGAVNDAPLLTSVNPLTGATEDTDFTISYEALAAAADESDVDSTNLQFRIESVSSGTLTLGGVPVTAGSTLLAAGQSLVWRPAQDANGVVEAFKVKAWDGQSASPTAVPVTISIAPVNDAPSVASGASAVYVEKGPAVAVDPNLSVVDVDDQNLGSASVRIDSPVAGDVLGFAAQGGISGVYDPVSGVLNLSGTASVSAYQTALRSVTYSSSSADPDQRGTRSTRTVSWSVTDANGGGSANGPQTSKAGDLATTYLTDSAYTLSANGTNPYIIAMDLGQDWTFEAEYRMDGSVGGDLNTLFSYGNYTDGVLVRTLRNDGLFLKNKNYGTFDIFGGTTTQGAFVPVRIRYSTVGQVGTLRIEAKGVLIADISGTAPLNPADKTIRLGSAHHANNEGFYGQVRNIRITKGSGTTVTQTRIEITSANDAPVLTSVNTLTGGIEDTDFTISYDALAAAADESDVDSGNLQFRIESLSSGTLTLGGTPVTAGSTLLAAGQSLVWRPALDANGLIEAFKVKAWDGKLASAVPVPVTVSVAAVADPVTIEGLVGVSRAYDGTRIASATGTPVLKGVANGADVTLTGSPVFTFAQAGVADRGVSIAVSGYTLTGAQAQDYVITQPTLSASITPRAVTVGGLSGVDKVYDGTTVATASGTATLAGVLQGDTVTVTGTPVFTFAGSKVGAGITIATTGYGLSGSQAGNYSLTQPTLSANITPKPLKVIGLTANNKIYDGTTAATVSGTASLVGVITGDAVSLAGTPVLQFASANVGTGIAITASGYALSGNQAGNYTLTQPTALTANITRKALTISGAMVANKVYDGTTVATVSFAGANLSGVLANDEVSLSAKDAIGTFADAGVGLGKPVTVSGLSLAGNAAGNYALGTPSGLKADIMAKTLSVVGLGGLDKVYDGTLAATVSGTGSLSGLISGDGVSLSGKPVFSFSSANVGGGIPITITGYALSGIHAANYTLTMPILSASITPKALTLKVLAASRAYRASNPSFEFEAFASQLVAGDTTAQVIGGNGAAGDLVYRLAGTTVASAVGVYRSEIRVDPASIDGSKASNYAVTVVSGDLTITPAALTITLDAGSLAQSFTGTPRSVTWSTQPSGVAAKATYNGSPNPPVVAGTYAVVVQSEDANYAGQVSGVLLIRSTLEALKSESFLMAAGLMPVTGGEGRYRLEASLGQTFAGAVPVVTGIQVEAGFWFTGRLSEALSPAGVQVPSAEVAAKGIAVLATTSSTGSSVDPSQAASVRDPQMASGIRLPEARLTVSPSPESLRVRIQVSGISGAQWKVQYLDGLRPGGWQDAGLLRLDSEGMGVIETDAVEDSAMRFYRLVQP